MKVHELIERLSQEDPDREVVVWDIARQERSEPVVGILDFGRVVSIEAKL